MRNTQVQAGQSLERVQQFLDAAVERLRTLVDAQGTRTREMQGEMSHRAQLEQVLVEKFVKPLAKYARAKLKGTPNYAALTPSGAALSGTRLRFRGSGITAPRGSAPGAPSSAAVSAGTICTEFVREC